MVKVEAAVGTTGAETDNATFLGGVYGVGKESGRHIFEKDMGQSSLEVRGSAVWSEHLWVRRVGSKFCRNCRLLLLEGYGTRRRGEKMKQS